MLRQGQFLCQPLVFLNACQSAGGADDQELLRNYPTLTQDDLTAAWAYYKQHSEECDRAIAAVDQDGDG